MTLRAAAEQALADERPTRVVPLDSTQPCRQWPGWISPQGYGEFHAPALGHNARAHRVVYEAVCGPIPDGLVIDHICRNRGCVNPAHMEVVTVAENTLRGEGPTAVNARKVECIRGHALSGDNLMIDYRGRRRCRTCENAMKREYHRRTARERKADTES